VSLEASTKGIQALGDAKQQREHTEEILLLVLVQQVLELFPDNLGVALDEHSLAGLDQRLVSAGVQVHLDTALFLG